MPSILPTFGLLLCCQLLGEIAARGLSAPVPGPVVGLVLLLVIIAFRPSVADTIRKTVTVILAHLSLMFVPAGVGVMGNLNILSDDWLALLAVLVLSTLFAMVAAVVTFVLISRLTGKSAE